MKTEESSIMRLLCKPQLIHDNLELIMQLFNANEMEEEYKYEPNFGKGISKSLL